MLRGPDAFTFKVTDDELLESNAATVDVMIDPVNDAPVAFNTLFPGVEDTPLTASFQAADVDVGDTLLFSIVTNGLKGNAVVDLNTGELTYTPNANANGTGRHHVHCQRQRPAEQSRHVHDRDRGDQRRANGAGRCGHDTGGHAGQRHAASHGLRQRERRVLSGDSAGPGQRDHYRPPDRRVHVHTERRSNRLRPVHVRSER